MPTPVQGIVDDPVVFVRFAVREALMWCAPHKHQLLDGEVELGRRLLQDDGGASRCLTHTEFPDILLIQSDQAGIGFHNPVERPQQARLAAAIRADQPHELTRLYCERGVPQDGRAVNLPRNMLDA